MSFSLIFMRVMMLTAMMLAGYVSAKTGVLKENAAPAISSLIMNISLPCNVFVIMLQPLDKELLPSAAAIALIAAIFYAVSIPASSLYCRLAGIKDGAKPLHRCSFIFSNVAFMGLPIAGAFFGSRALFFVTIWNIVFLIFYLAAAPAIFSSGNSFRFSDLIKNPPMAASLIGLLGMAFSLTLPAVISESLTMLAAMMTPLSMIFIGLTLAKVDLRTAFGNSQIWLTTFIRLVLLPLLFFFLVRFFTKNQELATVTALILGLPVAVLTSIYAEKYGADVVLASQLVFLSTVVSMLTLPLLVYLLQSY